MKKIAVGACKASKNENVFGGGEEESSSRRTRLKIFKLSFNNLKLQTFDMTNSIKNSAYLKKKKTSYIKLGKMIKAIHFYNFLRLFQFKKKKCTSSPESYLHKIDFKEQFKIPEK